MIYSFICIGVLWLAWIYMTWQPCVAMNIWKSRNEPTAKVAFVPLLVLGWRRWQCRILAFIPLRIFRLHKKTAQVWRWVRCWHRFSRCLGSHLPYSNSGIVEKTCLFLTGIWKILLGAIGEYPEVWPLPMWQLPFKNHHTSPYGKGKQKLQHRVQTYRTTSGAWHWSRLD